jgi:ubiquinone/menaquinone biosynthesis C-methylase UbiE
MSLQRIVLIIVGTVVGGGALVVATPFGRDVLFHVMPLRWTGEAQRLASVLQLRAGSAVADVGAGSGALIIELARIAGPHGQAYASERTSEQRRKIEDRAAASGVSVAVVAAAERATNLPDACCDAITMRMVMHHIADAGAFARDLRRAIRPTGRIGLIDFAPGALPHLAADHGVPQERVVAIFAEAGFDVAARHDWGGRTYLMVFRPR